MMKNWIKAGVCSLGLLGFSILEGLTDQQVKQNMLGELEMIKHVLESHYAPLEWKQGHLNWNLEEEIEKAKMRIFNESHLTTKKFQKIVKSFFESFQDYHLNVFFLSTESASLPFTVVSSNGRYFVNWIDQKRLPSQSFSIGLGDELLTFGGEPVHEVVTRLKGEIERHTNPETEQALAELRLTLRRGDRGDLVPKGSLTVEFRSVNQSIKSYQLMWEYCPEYITNRGESTIDRSRKNVWHPYHYLKKLQSREMWNPVCEFCIDPVTKSNRRIGAYQSYIPLLGEPVWMDKSLPFFAYIYVNAHNQSIGYVRISDYHKDLAEIEDFGRLMQFFEKQTDALVIDQVDNPGGHVWVLYELASMLTNKPLITPRHRVKINQEDILEARLMLSILDKIDIDNLNLEELLGDLFDENLFLNYQRLLFIKDYYRFILSEWEKGNLLTDPIYIEGVDHINPHVKYQYTKPKLLITNALDFSGGDFFPAIMQDNQCATVFGSRTAGAGGYVSLFKIPSMNGIFAFSYTGSIAERSNQLPIENLGVTPDILYQLTEEDLQCGYKTYIETINETVSKLLEKNPSNRQKVGSPTE
jgi:hypothetical protein